MAEGARLSQELRRRTSEFRRRRLEKQYLRVMHRLSAMRRAMALSRATRRKLSIRSKGTGRGVRKALGLGFGQEAREHRLARAPKHDLPWSGVSTATKPGGAAPVDAAVG